VSKLDGLTQEQRAHVGAMCNKMGDIMAADEREACARLVEEMKMGEILLAAGEMTAQERRTVRALQKWLAHKIRNRQR